MHTALCTLHSAHWIMHTALCTLHSAHGILDSLLCSLHSAHITLHTAYYTLHTTHCTLYSTHCKLHTTNCTVGARILLWSEGGKLTNEYIESWENRNYFIPWKKKTFWLQWLRHPVCLWPMDIIPLKSKLTPFVVISHLLGMFISFWLNFLVEWSKMEEKTMYI